MSIQLNQLFMSHMVLQADRPIRVFGTGEGTVHVRFLGDEAHTEARGSWMVELPAHPAGGPYEMELDLDGEKAILSDVLLGDVYLLAGQSNMEFKLNESNSTESPVYEDRPHIRFFCCERMESGDHFSPSDGWMPCTQENAWYFSSIGYFTGNMLYEKQGRPLGFVSCYQGASLIQSFISRRTLDALEAALPAEHRVDNRPLRGDYVWNHACALYDFALTRLFPMPMKAVLWYQGESNANETDAHIYDRLLRALIDDWRRDFLQPDLPFIVVQLADYDPRNDDFWRTVQAKQLEAGLWDNVTCVICRDVCATDHIHPPAKAALSRRIADALMG